MSPDLDLRQLSVDRDEPARHAIAAPRHLVSRYLLPAALVLGLLGVMAWAARDVLLPATPVEVVPVLASTAARQRAGTALFKAAGWVEPRPTPVRVAALAAGVVRQLLVVEDQYVEAGEPVANLVDDDARLALASSQADLKLREAELEQAHAALAAARTNFEQPVHLEAAAAEAEAQLALVDTELVNLPFEIRRALARLRLAEQDLQNKTRAGEVVSGLALDRAQSEWDAASALVEELDKRRESLALQRKARAERAKALRTQLELKTDEIRSLAEAQANQNAAEARLDQARVALSEAQLRMDRMIVRSPIAGRVLHLLAHPGTHLVGGMGRVGDHDGGVVVTLYRPSSLQVRVDVRFDDLPRVLRGQPVMIESPAVAQPLPGKVLSLTSLANIQKNTLEVKVAIDEPPEVLKPEMLVDVTFLAPEQAADAAESSSSLRLFVPSSLVGNGEHGAHVWLADQASGVAHRVSVKIGPRIGGNLTEIIEGLTPASRLITQPREGLRDDQRIRVVGEDENLGTSD